MTEERDLKKIVLVMTIGLGEAIRSKAISTREAEHHLFSPRTMRLMEDAPQIKHIIGLCTEFSDLEELAPNALDKAIVDVQRQAESLLREMPPCDYQQEPWLNRLLSGEGSSIVEALQVGNPVSKSAILGLDRRLSIEVN